MNSVLEAIAFELFAMLAWVLLFPVVIVLATPVILIAAGFQADSYTASVGRLYTGVGAFWMRHWCSFLP